MVSPNDIYGFSSDQISIAQGYRDSGDLPGMYRYLSQQVTAGGGDPRLANWLSTAADINDNTGFYAGFVRGATYSAGLKNGVSITADTFQQASNVLANTVLDQVTLTGQLSLDSVMLKDVSVAVTSLGLTPDGWAGTSGAMFPTGIGGLGMSPETATFYHQLNQFYDEHHLTPLDRVGRFFDSVNNDLNGFIEGSKQWWRENSAGPEDIGVLGDPGFWEWAANRLSEAMQNAAGAVGDPAYWDSFADRAAGLWRDASNGVGNTWDFWFDPLWHQATDSWSSLSELISELASKINNDSSYRIVRYDPLALDLDGDGRVTTSVDENWSGALFDNDGDGIRTATGWVGASDGLLVRDLDGNGLIESGRELFGDQTMLTDGSMATDGFSALAAMDSNSDGQVDATDAGFASIRVWRDANGNGTTETGELLSLTELGITSLSVSSDDSTSQTVDGGTRVGSGSYTRTAEDGTVSTAVIQEFDFDNDALHSKYTDATDIPEALRDLANLQGMGKLRDLLEASALSPALEQQLRAFSVATTREDQRALLDGLLFEWAKTSPTFNNSGIQVHSGGGTEDPDSTNVVRLRPGEMPVWTATGLPTDMVRKIRVVEAILGSEPITDIWWGDASVGQYLQIYNTFFEGSYSSLASQTRLKSYLELMQITFSEAGAAFDFTQISAAFEVKHAVDPETAIVDLGELLKFSGKMLVGNGWTQGEDLFRGWLQGAQGDATLQGTLNAAGLIFSAAGVSGALSVTGTAASEVLVGQSQADGVRESLAGGDGNDVILGGGGVDALSGGTGDDILSGGDAADTLDGGAGNDDLYGGAGSDSLVGGQGDDLLSGDAGNDSLSGGDNNDVLYGGEGGDSLRGNDGDDQLVGGQGNDYVAGNAGSDTYFFGRGAGYDTINNLDNSVGRKDVLQFDVEVLVSDVEVWRNGDDLSLQINGTDDRIDIQYYFRNDGYSDYRLDEIRFADGTVWDIEAVKAMVLVAGNGNDDIFGYATDDVIVGSEDNDWLVGRGGDDTLSGGGGADSLSGDDGNDTLAGDGGNDVLSGITGNDSLKGGADDDRLSGGEGNDRLEGGTGNDYLVGDAGNDVYVFARGDGHDTIFNNDSAAGRVDTLEFQVGIAASDVVATRIGDDLSLQIKGSEDLVYVQQYFRDDAAGAFRLDAISFADGTVWDVNTVKAMVQVGTDGHDVLVGYVGDDVLSGGLGDDTLTGWVGNDTLSGGSGADLLDGGDGNDTLSGDDGNDTLTAGAGDDQVFGGSGIDALYGGDGNDVVEGGADQDWLSGGIGDDQLNGGDGDDEIHGGEGADILAGGIGNDLLYGGQAADRYAFARGDGLDRVVDVEGLSTLALAGLSAADVRMRRDGTTLVIRFESSPGDEIRVEQFFDGATGLATMALAIDSGSVWNLSSTDIDAQVLLGTSDDDVIFGNVLGNIINGLGENDIVHAGAGDDVVDGGEGNDQLLGESGDDQLTGGVGDDRLEGGDGADTLLGDSGDDHLTGSAGMDSLDGGDGVDQLSGGADNDLLHGGVSNDMLDGGTGQDRMYGNSGNDVYLVDDIGDVVVEATDEGVDTIQSTVSFTLATDVERLELTGAAAADGVGNALANELIGNGSANRLEGLEGDDVLQGNTGDDTLVGGVGNDQLDGGSGIDQMTGGIGDDTYIVDTEGDLIVEQAGEGFDVVNAHSSYSLSGNIEKLVLVEGSGAWRGIGNGGDNTILGNSSSNRLDGGAGADILVGGLGDDTYVVDNVGDRVTEAVGEGDDTIESSIDYVLGATLENLTLLGTANLNGIGNDQDNVLIGNDGNNRLEGGLGADSLYGSLGDDYFIEESSADWVYESIDEGLDTVERHYETILVLKDNVENLILVSGVTTGNGNALANTITGNADANTLGGWDGADLLQGLAGDDALFGGNDGDQLLGGAGNDYLDGGTGLDQLEGGVGDDVYITDDAGDSVLEADGEGTDQVQSTASYVLSANIENLFLMEGAGAIDGAGNALDNYLSGNAASNVLSGMGGSDTMVGGGGDDLLAGGSGDDKYVFDATSGSDVVDNTGGGDDGIFFTGGITAERLSFSRDGDDLLIFVDAATVPSVRVTNHFLGGDAAIDYVQPDGGFMLTTAQINQIVAGSGSGGQYDQIIDGTTAGEQLVGSAGKDLLRGVGGNDELFGMGGDDTLQGGDGDDYLAGGNGSGTGSGADRLEGGIGNDTLTGEDGINGLLGGAGDDSYSYGGGQDTIDNTGGGFDGVFFDNGITAAQLGFSREGDDLLIVVDGDANSTVRVSNHFLGGDYAIDYVQPATGPMLDTATINALIGGGSSGGTPSDNIGNDGDYSNVVDGTSAGEQLLGSGGRDLIHGLGGNDTLFGFGGDDKFEGGDGDDYLSGGNGSFTGSGNDILIGGAGVDTLVGEDGSDVLLGGIGDDKYVWQAGSGSDLIDNSGGGTDWLFFNGVDRTRLSFHQDADDLVIVVDGDGSQQVRVQNHFLGGDSAISYVQPSDGFAIPASEFANLLTPMPAGLVGAQTQSLMSSSLPVTDDSNGSVLLGGSHALPTARFTDLPALLATGDTGTPARFSAAFNRLASDHSGRDYPPGTGSAGRATRFGGLFRSLPTWFANHQAKPSVFSARFVADDASVAPPATAPTGAPNDSKVAGISIQQPAVLQAMESAGAVGVHADPRLSHEAPVDSDLGGSRMAGVALQAPAVFRTTKDAGAAEWIFDEPMWRQASMAGDGYFGQGVPMGREAQQLIEAMSRFQPLAGATELSQQPFDAHGMGLATSYGAPRPLRQLHEMSLL